MSDDSALFDVIYSTDLVYGRQCWQLCGDAHCCSFSRYQPGHRAVTQQLILLPGEYQYMESRGYLVQYKEYRRYSKTYTISDSTLTLDMISVTTERGQCPCNHDTRPTTCRLYPMLPLFDVRGRLVGVEPYYALEDEIEKVLGVMPTCQITSLHSKELSKFLTIANTIASSPNFRFHLMAYDAVRRWVYEGFAKMHQNSPFLATAAGVLEAKSSIGIKLLRGSLFNAKPLVEELTSIARALSKLHGPSFQEISVL